jgi:ribonuclease R
MVVDGLSGTPRGPLPPTGQTCESKSLDDRTGSRRNRERTANWAEVQRHLHVGQRGSGRIRAVVNFGVFVDLEEFTCPGVDGLVHRTNLDIQEEFEVETKYTVGDIIDVVIARIDVDSKRIELLLNGNSKNEPDQTQEHGSESVAVKLGNSMLIRSRLPRETSPHDRRQVSTDADIVRALDTFLDAKARLLAVTRADDIATAEKRGYLSIATEGLKAEKRLAAAKTKPRSKTKAKKTGGALVNPTKKTRTSKSVWTVSGGLPGLGKRR